MLERSFHDSLNVTSDSLFNSAPNINLKKTNFYIPECVVCICADVMYFEGGG